MAAYGGAVPLTLGNCAHFGNGLAGLGRDLVPDLMNGVVFYRGVRGDVSALDLAVLADTGLGRTALAVPEPGASLLLAGLPLLAGVLRRRRRQEHAALPS